MPEPARLRWHEDPEAFRDLLTLTAARAGFLVRLVEKDYFCSVAEVAAALVRTP